MRFIKSVIILAGVTSFGSCRERSEPKDRPEDSRSAIEQEPVLGLWKSSKEQWSKMDFLEDGTVKLENYLGELSLANWKRIEGSVYKIRIKHELVGGYDRIESSTTIPKPVNGSIWIIKPKAVQYYVWNEGTPESERLPPITVEGDRLQKDQGDSLYYYKRIR